MAFSIRIRLCLTWLQRIQNQYPTDEKAFKEITNIGAGKIEVFQH